MPQGQLALADTYLDEHNANNANGEEGVIYLGRNVNVGTMLVGLVRLEMPIIDSDIIATLKITPQYSTTWLGSTIVNVNLALPNYEWEELQAAWANMPTSTLPINGNAPTIGPVNLDGPLDADIDINVTPLVMANAAIGGPLAFLITPATEARTTVVIYSKDSGTHPERGPRLLVLNG